MTGETALPEPRILLVEDNPVDVLMIQRALSNGGFQAPPVVVNDGEPALAYLAQRGEFQGAPAPDLVILDLNLRKVDGPEVLSAIRATPRLKNVLVIILSSSPETAMIEGAPCADLYLEKPATPRAFLGLGGRIREFYSSARRKASADAAGAGSP